MDLRRRTLPPAARGRKKHIHLSVEELEPRLAPAAIGVNAAADVHAIDPNIYGSAFATTAQLADLNLTINRDGGNASDTYNWQADDTNHASDWFYESIASGSGNGQSMDAFVNQTKNGGAQADLTVPIMPYVATLGPNGSDLGSYPVSLYGSQQYVDPYAPNFGNGVTPGGANITDTNPLYNYAANSPALEKAWIQHLLNTFGTPQNGGVQYFTLGNEPGLWNSTHRDIHPSGETNAELLNDFINYGSMIKSIDPNAQILGPEEWGWTNYFVDGADAAAGNYGATYGSGLNAEQWLLQQLDQYQAQHGVRLLDAFTLHYYPQESVNGDNNGGVDSNNVDQATELLRNQVTRSLWDPGYVDPSWIASTGIDGGKVDLIPMMQSWVDSYYPGTQTGITEYNFGAEGDMNGATTQADLYGIFGQQGLDLATRWTTPATASPTYLAMKLWRNYDGNDSGFGNLSVGASVANPDQTDAFAALRSADGALTVAVINKNLYNPGNPSATTSVTVNLSGFASTGVSQEWQLAAVNPGDQTHAAITHLADVHYSGNSFTINVPMESVTMLVLEPATGAAPTVTANPSSVTIVAGQSASFTARANGTPTPSVQWQVSANGGSTYSNIAGATATTFSFTPVLSQNGYLYRAVFTNSNGSASTGAATLTLSKASTATMVNVSTATSVFGQPVTMTATVSPVPPGAGEATGTVTFYRGSVGGILLGTGTLNSSGAASLTLANLPVGLRNIYAQYNGDSNFLLSDSPAPTPTSVTVSQAGTTTAVALSTTAAVFGQPVTLTATVRPVPPGAGEATGTVTFYRGSVGGTLLGTGTLNSSGAASLTLANLPVGLRNIYAQYNGDSNFLLSDSPTPTPTSVTVSRDGTIIAVALSTAASAFGQPVTMTATVSPVAPGAGTPTGTVTFYRGSVGGTFLGSGTLNSAGQFSVTLSNLPVGQRNIFASFGGDVDFLASSTLNPVILIVS